MSLPSGTPLGPPGRSARRGCWRGGGCRGARWCGAWAGIDFVCLRCSGPAVFRVFAAALLRFSVATPRSSPARSRAAPPRCVRGGPRGSPAPGLPWRCRSEDRCILAAAAPTAGPELCPCGLRGLGRHFLRVGAVRTPVFFP